MTIKYRIKSEKDNASIYLVFLNGKNNCYWRNIQFIKCNPKNWDNKKGQFKATINEPEHYILNSKLLGLKALLSMEFSLDSADGEIIDAEWIDNKIYSYFKQEKKGNREKIYLYDFIKTWWEENNGKLINKSSDEPISEAANDGYKNAIQVIKDFEKNQKHYSKFKSMDSKWHKTWVDYLLNVRKFSYGTAKFQHRKLKYILNVAESNYEIKISSFFKSKDFLIPNKTKTMLKVEELFLTIEQLDILMSDELTSKLSKAQIRSRDILVVLCWTGIRYGNYKRLTEMYKGGDYIDVMTTIKTNAVVTIPLSPAVKVIIHNNNGKLPKAENQGGFNLKIKEVCKLAGFNREVIVSIKSKDKSDDVRAKPTSTFFYNGVKSHIGRGSFATNMYGNISDQAIMAIAGWSSLQQMKDYVKDQLRGKVVEAVEFFKTEEEKYKDRYKKGTNLKTV